ncbi:MAG: glycosyltransferase family 4 protein [Candidatus Omnitrophota bacterium]|nr:MAG: glycosyltransferase family 4 protein [Candidatus Omnitrophota bacterium]
MLHFANIIEQGLKDKGHRVHVIRPEPIFGLIKQTGTGLGKWLGYVDKFIIFPKLLRKATRCTDIIHILDHSNAVYVKYLDGMPHIATCEDLLAIRSALGEFKENITKWSGRKLQKMILAGLNQTQHVVCISESTRKDLLRVSKLNPESVSRIYMGLNYNYSPMGESEAKLHLERLGINFSNPFLLNVSKNNWYKNRHGLLDIFRFLDEHTNKKQFNLIIAGSPLSLRLRKLVRRYGLREKIYEVIFPENEDLRALYSMAKALIYPSIAEGFGWPIIEAQACGCPVFTTGKPPMTEAGGGAAVYFDPNKPQEAAQIIAETLSDNAKVAKMKEEGLENVKRFSVERMIEEYIKVYRTAIEENQGKNNP